MCMNVIETRRLALRPFTVEDAEAACRNSRQPTARHFMSDMVLETAEDARKWILWIGAQLNAQEPCQVLAVERKEDHAVIGLVGVAPKKEIGNEVEILFAISDEHQNNGYATEAARAMVWWTFERAGQDMLSAIVKPENKASRRVVEKLGFVYCDTRILPYDGQDCTFDYFRFYHTDYLPGPEWETRELYKPERMSAFFDTRAPGYDEHMLSGGWDEDYKNLARAIPHTEERLEILDIGCGTGIELEYIWRQAPNAHITCVDISRGMLDILLKNHPNDHDRITLVEASYLNWDYPSEAFDIVISSATMHHFWPEEKIPVYRAVRRALKPGGCYIESDFIVDPVHAEQYRQRYAAVTSALPKKAGAGEYHIDIPCSLDTQKDLLAKAGFEMVEVLHEHIRPRGSGAVLRAR